MRVLVAASIWSAALRRDALVNVRERRELQRLVEQGLVVMIGPIRQEILSGIRDAAVARRIRDQLRPFPDWPVETGDYEEAADYYNRCHAKGIQGSGTDLLICAVAIRHHLSVFTADNDFVHYSAVLPLRLHPLP